MTTTGDEEPASVLSELYAASEAEVAALIDADRGQGSEPDRAPVRDAPVTRSESSNTSRAALATLRRRSLRAQPRRGEQRP